MMDTLPVPEAVFFDWDGTLVDSYPLILAAHNYARDKLSLPALEVNEFRPYFGKPRDFVYETLYPGQETIARTYFEDFVFEHHDKHLNIMPGAKTLLDDLQNQNFKMAVISNKKAALLNAEIQTLGWEHYFETILGSGDTEKDKPDPEPLHMAVRKTAPHAKVENIWYVGDSATDLECAHRAGCISVLLRETPTQSAYQPNLIFRNCEELHAFMLQCLENSLKRTV